MDPILDKIIEGAVAAGCLLVAGKFVLARMFRQQERRDALLEKVLDGVNEQLKGERDTHRYEVTCLADGLKSVAEATSEQTRAVTLELTKQTHELRELRRDISQDLPRPKS